MNNHNFAPQAVHFTCGWSRDFYLFIYLYLFMVALDKSFS